MWRPVRSLTGRPTCSQPQSRSRRRAARLGPQPRGGSPRARHVDAKDASCDEADLYPRFEEDGGVGELLPKRDPGSFPAVRVRKGLGATLNSILTASGDAYAPSAAVEEVLFDPLRDGPLRYLGYANECGEAFAAWLPYWGVPFSYAVAVGYVLTDTADKGRAAYRLAGQELGANAALNPEVDMPRLTRLLALERTLDTLVWQLLASVICPGYTIHTIVALGHAALIPLEGSEPLQEASKQIAAAMSLSAPDVIAVIDKSLPTAMGLAAIPFIVHPIDNTIHGLMNETLRPAMRRFICGSGQGALAELQVCSEDCAPPDD